MLSTFSHEPARVIRPVLVGTAARAERYHGSLHEEGQVISMRESDTAFPFQPEEVAEGIIVVVEDDLETAQMIRDVIETGTPYQALLLQTPNEALRSLEELAQLKPVLFLLDVVLPAMSGVELYDRLHAEPRLASVPALFLSAMQGNRSFQQAAAVRQLEMLEKPFDLEALYSWIDHLIEQERHLV